ncbi:MAG: TIGR01777 family protein [Ignavibacteria bacterium GWF2_33_9]|nr:MAG: TIGR01777 family protein [Ignavibacteria bacterium GWF2_33_9]
MKFVLVGGTGALGKAIAKEIVARDHEFCNISRNPEHSRKVLPNATAHSDFSQKNTNSLLSIFKEADVVINLAGSNIASGRWTHAYKSMMYNSRIVTTNHIIDLMNQFSEEKTLISTSAIGYYGDQGDKLLDEHCSAGEDFLAKLCYDWERASQNVNSNIRLVNPRIGVVLDKHFGALAKMLPAFRFFVGGPIGSGEQYFSWIHIQDYVNAIIEMSENSRYEGAYNLVAPNPVTMKDFAKELGKTLHRPALFRVPELALKLILGESSYMVTASQRVSSKRLETKMFHFKFPELDSALENLLG